MQIGTAPPDGRVPSNREVAARIIQRDTQWRRDPAGWVHARLQAETWSMQRQILATLEREPRVAVRACHTVGKTFTAASATGWWLETHPPGEAFVVTTAPTGAQVKAVLWREINRMHGRAGLPGRTNLTEWYVGNELVALGRKPSEYDPDAFQGIHARFVLVIIDEASGVPVELWNAVDTLASNVGSKILAIGNPDDAHGEFARVCKENSGWATIQIGYEDTPAFTGEAVSERLLEVLIAPEWVDRKRKDWGENSPLFTSKCKGEFPTDVEDGVVPYSLAIGCRYLELPEGLPAEGGLDVGAGGDRTVLRERRGPRAGREEVFRDADPMRAVGRIIEKVNEWGLSRVKVDVIGVGWALAGRLRELSSRHNPIGAAAGETTHAAEIVSVNVASAATGSNAKRFVNKRAQLWWETGRELSRLQTWDLSEVDDDVIAELTAAKYDIVDSSGRIRVEPKDEIIKRLGRSPDRGEALLLAFWEETAAGMLPGRRMSNQVVA